MVEISTTRYDVVLLLGDCMSTAILESRMARKAKASPTPPENGKRDDVAVKFDRSLAEKLKLIVQRRGDTMSNYLSDLCRTHIEKEYAKVVREMADEVGGGKY